MTKDTRILNIADTNADDAAEDVIQTLNGGGIVVYPTETFYALGAKFDREDTLKKIYNLKGRLMMKAIPLIVGNIDVLNMLTDSVNPLAFDLIRRFWPGPLTILFQARTVLSSLITSEGKVAARIPGNSFALTLARKAGFPITATSANPSGMPPASNVNTTIEYFMNKVDIIINSGETPGGMPSTLVNVSDNKLKVLREGAIRLADR